MVKTFRVMFLIALIGCAFVVGSKVQKNFGKPDYSSMGIPATEEELEEGKIYVVENFHFSSWGYLAQLKESNHMVGRQYRITTIQEMRLGRKYKVVFKGKSAYFEEIGDY